LSEAVTMYRADDGCIFKTESEAVRRDRIIQEVKKAMEPIGELPPDPGCEFANGSGYYKHSLRDLEKVKRNLLHVFESNGFADHWTGLQNATCEKWQVDPWAFGRRLDGSCPPLEEAYGRLCCIDDYGREFGQPYFTKHPDRASLFERQRPLNALQSVPVEVKSNA